MSNIHVLGQIVVGSVLIDAFVYFALWLWDRRKTSRPNNGQAQRGRTDASRIRNADDIYHHTLFFPESKIPCRFYYERAGGCQRKNCSYSHEAALLGHLISYLDGAKSTVDICVYLITCSELCAAVLNVKNRGVRVRVITEGKDCFFDAGSMFSHHSNPNNFTQLTPSQIHFVRDYSTHCFEPDANLLNALSSQISKLNELPKIQVVERNGAWFALNNSYLHVLRELEKQGKCLRTQVDVVPLSRVPKTVQETMVVVSDDNKWERIRNNNQSLTLKLDDEHNGLCSSETHLKTSSPSDPAFLDANFRADNFNAGGYFGKEADSTKECHSLMNKVEEDELKQGCSHDAPELHGGPGRLTKRGYHKLSDGGCGGSDECPIVPLHDSETEGTSTSSFSGTDCSDFDPDGEVESDSESEEALTCNVCDRSFPSTRKLAQHQQRKRHFGCSVCDSIFPTLMTLELHKESLEHWSDDEGIAQGGSPSDEDSDDDHDDDDDDNIHSPTEELERLL